MAEGKKSFILYTDMLDIFEKLPDKDAGQLIKHIFYYVNDLSPETDNLLVEIAFSSIKRQLKRDLKRYELISKIRKEAGRKGGIQSGVARNTKMKRTKQTKQTKQMLKTAKQNEAKRSDNDNDNDNEIIKKSKHKKKNLIDWFDDDWKNSKRFQECVTDYENHRIEIKKPLTEIAAKNVALKLKRMTIPRAVKAIRFSLENGWLGIYENKKQKLQDGNSNGTRTKRQKPQKYKKGKTITD